MEPNELADEIETLIVTANEVFGKSVAKVQTQLYDSMLLKLKDLELDEGGYIKQNATNRKILRDVEAQFDIVVAGSSYQSSVEKHLKVISKINKLNSEYFNNIKDFTPNKNFLKALQSQAIKNVNELILQDGLRAQIQIPLNQILEQNISTGGSFKGMLQQVKNFIEGDSQVEGRLLRYTKTFLKDTLFQYSRSFQESVTSDLKLDWYSFSGGTVDRSRDFCIERSGKFFHRSEIEAWAKLSWKGKNPLTTESSIFVLLGGYNCSHSLIPVSKVIVPKEDLLRIE